MEIAKGLTKRTILSRYIKYTKLTAEYVKLTLKLLPRGTKLNIQFRTNDYCYVLVPPDESTRN